MCSEPSLLDEERRLQILDLEEPVFVDPNEDVFVRYAGRCLLGVAFGHTPSKAAIAQKIRVYYTGLIPLPGAPGEGKCVGAAGRRLGPSWQRNNDILSWLSEL